MQMNHPGLRVDHSHATMRADIQRDSCLIEVQGQTREAMKQEHMTLYIYGD